MMESKKRKTEKNDKISSSQIKSRRNIEKDVNEVDAGKVCTVTLHWSKKNSAYLLKCIYRRVRLLGNSDVNDDHFWRDIEKDMKEKFAWVFIALCQEKWKKLREETEKYMIDHDASQPRPDFFYVIREIIRMINDLKNGGFKAEDEDDESVIRGFSVADPDAVKLEPFAGVMDSMGNMYLHEPLFEIVNSFEALPDCSDEELAEKHGVEEVIVEWVRENQESILRGSLQCVTCNKRILKRETFIEHELDCFLSSHVTKRDDGGFEVSYEHDDIEEPWSAETVAALIKTFKEKSLSYVSSDGFLRQGIWMEIFQVLKSMEARLTPPLCREKWTELVNSAREYSDSLKEKEEVPNDTLLRPRFFSEISDIVDLDSVESDSPQCYIPKELVPEDGRDNVTPRVFLSTESDHDEGEFEDEGSEEEINETIDDDSIVWSDEENYDSRSKKKSRLYLEHKVDSLSVRVKMLEEENATLRSHQSDVIPGVFSRLDKFFEQQQEAQTAHMDMLKEMTSMFERHHKECMEILRTVGDNVSKGKRKIL